MAEAPLPSGPIATTLGIISKPLYVKILQTAALTASAFVCGQTATVSVLTVPALLQTPSSSLLARQWHTFFKRGLILGPGCIMPSGLIFGWLASREPSIRTSSFKLYAVASALLFGTIPYTKLLVNSISAELIERSNKAAKADVEAGDVKENYEGEAIGAHIQSQFGSRGPSPEQESTHKLVDDWAILNLGRGLMCAVASLCGTWAVIHEDLSFFELLP